MTTNKKPVTAAPIADVLAERWSPRSFDKSHVLSKDEALSILEAGRWAPSANNMQPWRFAYISREDALHNLICEKGLTGFNQAWAPSASALILVAAKNKAEEGTPLTKAAYDAGLAASLMQVQAQELGLHTHQIGGLVRDEIKSILNIDEDLDVLVLIAVGKLAPAENLEGPAYDREIAPRVRLELNEVVIYGQP